MTLRYLLRRLLLAIPTTLAILLVLFALVNLVPVADPFDAPGEAGGGASAGSTAAQRREGQRVFREQYGLDLPVFVNLRFRLRAADLVPGLERATSDDPIAAARARGEILEMGRFAVAPLLGIAHDDSLAPALRDAALRLLPEAASVTLRLRDDEATRAAKLEANRRAAALEVPDPPVAGAPLDETARATRIAGWSAIVTEDRERFAPEGLERVAIALRETRFGVYVANLLHLDFGVSLADRQPVLPIFLQRLARSAWLGLGYIVLSLAAAIPLGLLCAAARRRGFGGAVAVALYAIWSVPSFFLAVLLQRGFAAGEPFEWFPLGGYSSSGAASEGAFGRSLDVAHHLSLPIFALALPTIVVLARWLEGSLSDALASHYVVAARAKGLPFRRVLFDHALRNALLPLATALGAMVPVLVGGAASIEFVFDVPGVGLFLLDAVMANDFNVILLVTLAAALATQAGYLLSDALYVWLDPRIEAGRSEAR